MAPRLKIVAIALTVAFATSPIVIEVTRSIVHARRVRTRGIGGTGDIAMLGTLVAIGCAVLSVACWIAWYFVG